MIGEKNILVKVHKAYRWVVAICDSDLRGRILIEGNKKLDLTGRFFDGELISEEDLKEEIEIATDEDATFNIVGEKSIEACKKVGIISDEGVMTIDGIPFALVLL